MPVAEYLWAVPFFPFTNLEFYELIYHYMGIKEVFQEAYRPHNVAHLSYQCSDEWGAMVSAALRDFPQPPAGARQVNIEIPR